MTAPKAPADETLLPCPNPWCEAAEREGDFRPQIHYSNFAMVYVACTSCTMAGPTRQHRPSDHLPGQRRWIHGPIQPMEPRGFLARIFGR